jgi:two-component system phosphate regulon sensor histidine kinase PhoR
VSIRWRLFLSYVLVTLVAVGTLGFFAARGVEQRHIASLESSLRVQSLLIGDLVREDWAAPTLDERVKTLGRESGLRITLVQPDGVVLADSEHDPKSMENHASRPEIRAALAQGSGQSLRYSETLRVEMLYVATALQQQEETIGVVRVAVPLHQVELALRQIRNIVLTFGLLGALLSLLLSLRFSQRLTSAVRELDQAARRFSRGDLEVTVHPRGRDELTALAESFNDMASRLRATIHEVQEEKQKAEAILTQVGEAILVTEASGRITLCNEAAERAFGVTCQEAAGRGVVEVTQSPALETAFRAALETGETAACEVQVVAPRARLLEAIVTAVGGEQRLGAVAVLHDVTELRRLETVRSEFVSNASHELRTPITAIKAMAETLLSGGRDDPELVERFLPELERQADRLAALVQDMLDLAALEAGQPLHRTSVNVAEVVATVAAELKPLAAQRGFSIEQEAPEGLMVSADWLALHRALANLLDNAIKYTDPGGTLGVRAAASAGSVQITVWDTGLGMLSSDLPRIFERFYRVDKARSLRLGGTGLGLSIVKHLVEAMGGQVTVASELRKGSQFTITLPAATGAIA